MAMGEVERETVIEERLANRRALEDRRRVKEALQKRKAAAPRKPHAGPKSKQQIAMEEIRNRRAMAKVAAPPKPKAKKKKEKRTDDDDDYGASDQESEGEPEEDLSADEEEAQNRFAETTWEDLKSAIKGVQLMRNQLEQWVDEPFFDETVVGCFVRVNIGANKESDEKQYRLCEVVAIKNEENSIAYKLLNGQFTRRKLTVKLGSARKSWPITQISNGQVCSSSSSTDPHPSPHCRVPLAGRGKGARHVEIVVRARQRGAADARVPRGTAG